MTNPPPTTGSASITLPSPGILPAVPPHTYLGMARHFVAGAKILATSTPSDSVALAFLASQAAECGLKAFLSRSGHDERLKTPALRHSLVGLWNLAVTEGLLVSTAPPAWLETLAHLHAAPYYLRYSTGVHGLSLPAAQPMTEELVSLITQVVAQS